MPRLLLALAFAFAFPAYGADRVYKCTDGNGRTVYGDTPCDAAARPLKLPEDPRANPSDANMCRQLLDETQRLGAEAQAQGKRGKTESSAHAKKRHAIEYQYETRCAGIARSTSR